MAFTNFPNGITSLGIPTFGASMVPPLPSNYLFVQERTTAGVSAGSGTAQDPFNTLEQALAQCTSGANDVIFMTGTVHPTATIAWSKNNTHLVGLCAPLKRGKRARLSVTGSTAYGPLVSVTGNGCIFQNIGTFYGFAVTGSTSPICWQDTGGRNSYNLVEFLGFGDGTASTGTSNQTGARAFKMNTSTGESTFRDCVFGVDTIQRGATNYTVEIAGGAPRISFEGCDFEADLAAGGAGGSHLLIGASGIDRYLEMRDCIFNSATKSSGTAMTQCMNINSAAGGYVILDGCTGFGFTHWETSASGCLVINMAAPTAHDGGIAVAASPS